MKYIKLNEVVDGNLKKNGFKLKDLFYDWMCLENDLFGKSKFLIKKVKELYRLNIELNERLFENNKTFVLFKNILIDKDGNTQDEIRFLDENLRVKYLFKIKKYHSVLFTRTDNFAIPVVSGTWQTIFKYLRENEV